LEDTLGVGIIGLGGFGRFLAEQWSAMDNIEVVAVSDADSSCAEHVPSARFYSDYHGLLDDNDVQIVSIATPPSTHAQIALESIDRGKNVLVEKPVALNTADARRIKEAALEHDVVAAVNFILRYSPIVEGVRKIIADGVLGMPRRIDLRNYATHDTVPPRHWFWDRSVSGGIMIEHGVHFFDMSRYILDKEPLEAAGYSVWRNSRQEDRVFGIVRFEEDIVGTYWHSFTRPKAIETTTMHIACDLGEIEISGWIPLEVSFWGWSNDSKLETLLSCLPNAQIDVNNLPEFETASCDRTYRVNAEIRGSAKLEIPKLDAYGYLVRAVLADLAAAVNNPNHVMKVTMDDAISAVAVAERATVDIGDSLLWPIG